MTRRLHNFLPILLLILTSAAQASNEVEKYEKIKSQIVNMDEASREIMAKIYEMNHRLKNLSSKRERISIKLMAKDNEVKNLSKEIIQLEASLKEQRRLLSRRMRALYMLGEDKLVQLIFTAQSAEDLNQSLKYLERFAQSDFKVVAAYKADLKSLTKKQSKLKGEVKQLLSLRDQMNKNEKNLNERQEQKSQYLSSINQKRQKNLQKLKSIKKNGNPEFAKLLDVSFFEKKGSIKAPFTGQVLRGYGIIENENYGYKLIHKGLSYAAEKPLSVTAVFKGTVVFSKNLPSFGKTLIIDHGDHYYSVYSGLNDPKVKPGEEVSAEQILDENISSLYFEIRHFSDAIDPRGWLLTEGKSS